MTYTKRDALAQKHYPKLWQKAQELGKSKARNRLRNWAERAEKEELLAAKGASCANCACFEPVGPCGSYCKADTDFYGYAITQPDNLCYKWGPR